MITSKDLGLLFDENSFCEIGEGQGSSVITGYGTVDGALVYAFLQDREREGGAFGVTSGRKIASLYRLALKAKAPIVGFLDSTGFLIGDGAEGLNAFSEVYGLASKAKDDLLQIMITGERCLGQMLGLANMADLTFNGRDIKDALKLSKEILKVMPPYRGVLQEQLETGDDLNRECPDITKKAADGKALLSEISDDGFFLEVMEDTAKELTTGFIKINGMMAAALSGCGKALGYRAIIKARRLVETASKFGLGIVNISNTEGFSDEDPEMTAIASQELIRALSQADVPKIDIITGRVRGGIYSVFNGRYGASDLTFMWKDATVEIIDPKVAAELLYGPLEPKEAEEKTASYISEFASSDALSKKGLADKVIAPEDTRKYLSGALEIYCNVF